MPGFRDSNLRRGDIQEDLGLLLLKGLGLVAPIPRTEDVGVDAFVTLLQPSATRVLVPQASFLVQIKAQSVRKIEFHTPESLEWLYRQEAPLFIARVDIKTLTIKVYPTHDIDRHRLERLEDWTPTSLHLEPPTKRERINKNIRRINIRPPALSWSAADMSTSILDQSRFDIMQAHVAMQRRNSSLRILGQVEQIAWNEGELPTIHSYISLNSEYLEAYKALVPPTQALLEEIAHKKDYRDFAVILAMIEMMRKRGVDPDPQGYRTLLAFRFAKGEGLTDRDIIELRSFKSGNQLDLTETIIVNDSLKYIPAWIEQLSLKGTNVDNEGLKELNHLRRITRLNCANTAITDDALDLILNMNYLVWLNIKGSRITQDGINKIKTQKPDLEIVY